MARLTPVLYLVLGFGGVLGKELQVLILHNNDMHSRFEETDKRSSKCTALGSDQCYGGFARVMTVLRRARADADAGRGPPVLYLNAGDTYTGTAWFVTHREGIVIEFLNILRPDAACLGNHEFDEGVTGLLPLLKEKMFPIVTANVEDPRLVGLEKSTILTVEDYEIGIIGYLTPQTAEISFSEDVIFTDEVTAINKECEKLTARGIKTIFALGHSGFEMDKIIAKNCPCIDLVVGGHTNTFLWNGPKPDAEEPEDSYPTVVKQKSGKKVPVVQAYAYTKYMGKLYIKIDTETGKLTSFKGDPILLNSSIPQEEGILRILDKYRKEIDELDHKIMGKSKVYLEGRDFICRRRECNLGNLITDAFVDYRARNYGGHFWTDTAIAILNGGAIRSSIDSSSRSGNISFADLAGTMPFNNDLMSVILSGKDLLNVLEFSVHGNGETSEGEFLQFSGIKVTYDRRKNVGNRLISASARCAACTVPVYEPVDPYKDYKIILTSFLSGGGDGYKIFKHNARNRTVMNINDYDSVLSYIQQREVVYPAEEGRITLLSAGTLISSQLFLIILPIFGYIISNNVFR